MKKLKEWWPIVAVGTVLFVWWYFLPELIRLRIAVDQWVLNLI